MTLTSLFFIFAFNTSLNAQCDCKELKVTTITGNSVTFACQVVNIDYTNNPHTTMECLYEDVYTYDRKIYSCGNNVYEEITYIDNGTGFMTCNNGTKVPLQNPGLGIACFSPKLPIDILNENTPKDMMGSVSAGCYALFELWWPAGTMMTNQVIGETSYYDSTLKIFVVSPVTGTIYPPSTMYLPCTSFGCCTLGTEPPFTPDPSTAHCGNNADLSLVTFNGVRGYGNRILEPCTPRCGTVNMQKSTSQTKVAIEPTKKYYLSTSEEAKALANAPKAYLKNEGNTLVISNISNVKQVNILDMNGKNTKEVKNLKSPEIDFSGFGAGMYLIQLVKLDNTVSMAQKVVK